MSILDGFYSLSGKTNKAEGSVDELETQEGVSSDKLPALTLTMPNEELTQLTKKWEKTWIDSKVYSEWKEHYEENERYWKGDHFDRPKVAKGRPLQDNVIFESVETYLPQITRRNPDPMVTLVHGQEETEEAKAYVKNLKLKLGEIADEVVLRLKLKTVGRHWAIFLLGVAKVTWDSKLNIPTAKVIRPMKLILDPESTVDEEGYHGEYLGEYRKKKASEIISILEELGGEEGAIAYIKEKTKNSEGEENLSTTLTFIEWWTDQYMCWTLKEKVLLKKKNIHWNHLTQEEGLYDEFGKPPRDANGEIQVVETPGVNHFLAPGIPYVLLSVFNLGSQPVDDTSLIGQNLASQDLVNKRIKQIDKNADSMNGGMVVSLERSGLTDKQARGVTEALRKGGTVTIPSGAVGDAVARMSAPGLPQDVYVQLQDTRARMRDVFGTRGSSPAGLADEKTVRGKMQNRVLDTDRIGGGVSEYLEQVADKIYNWFVQLLYVYDDDYKNARNPRVSVSVKEGSLLPKDSLTLANQAIELASQGRMSLLDLYKSLDYSNPEELAANAWLETNAPELLYVNDPRVKQVIEARQQQGGEQKPPSLSISFKDLPPEGQAQLAGMVGIDLHPEAIAAYAEQQANKEVERKIATEIGQNAIPENL